MRRKITCEQEYILSHLKEFGLSEKDLPTKVTISYDEKEDIVYERGSEGYNKLIFITVFLTRFD